MDNLRFWNRKLTPAEITSLFSNDFDCQTGNTVSAAEYFSAGHRVNIYPNPATDKLTVTGSAGLHYTFSDVSGKKVVVIQRHIENQTVLDISDVSPGIYLLQATDEQGRMVQSEKIIVLAP